jgi:hypothetical protein
MSRVARALGILAALVIAAALVFSISCAPLSTIGTYNRPPSICSHLNASNVRVEVVLQDNSQPTHHTQYVGNADPGGHVCASWTLPGDLGRWGILTLGGRGSIDTTWTPWFQAWALR